MIDSKRTLIEIQALEDIFPEVRYDLDEGWVEARDAPFPAGWTPRCGAIRFELPSPYPGSVPDVYLPKNMEYQGERPEIMIVPFGENWSAPAGWTKFCLHKEDLQWDPGFDTLVSLTRHIGISLHNPNEANPVQRRRRR